MTHSFPFRRQPQRPARATIAAALLNFALLFTGLTAAPKPNVLFIAVDDLKPRLGCYGDKTALTPNINRLAARGVVFERAYVQQAVCGPSRASVLSGLRPDASGVMTNITRLHTTQPHLTLLPGHFKAHGYHAVALGKVHHSDEDAKGSWSEPPWRPYHMGPSTREYLLPENIALVRKLESEGKQQGKRVPALSTIKGAPYEAVDLINDIYPDGLTANIAVHTLRRLKDRQQPFFLGVGFIKPHLPFACPQKYWDLYNPEKLVLAKNTAPPKDMPKVAYDDSPELRGYHGTPPPGEPVSEAQARKLLHGYLACVSYMDAQVGLVLDTLQELGLRDNTIVVLWGDHGWQLGEHGIWGKATNFEEATRAPLIVSAPGFASGRTARGMVEFVDIYPSLAELCGLPRPPHLQGSSFVPLLRDPKSPGKPAAFSQYTRPGNVIGYSIRTDRWRYTSWRKDGAKEVAAELYDHAADPQENVNLAADTRHAATINELGRQLHAQRTLWTATIP